jgi:DNA-binding Lrp family transcriptional regulator
MANDPFAALAHPIRREIGVSKPTITRHLKMLEEAGVVTRVIDGRSHRLALRPDTLGRGVGVDREPADPLGGPLRRGRRVPGGASGPKVIEPPAPYTAEQPTGSRT